MEQRITFHKKITVQCYSGYKADERPTSFTVDEQTHQVSEIADRWYDPNANYFKVVAEDGALYLLRHVLDSDLWELLEND